jgi:hypothetical protein
MANMNQGDFSTLFGKIPEAVADMLPDFSAAPAHPAPSPPPPAPDSPAPAADHFPDFTHMGDPADMPFFISHGIDSII